MLLPLLSLLCSLALLVGVVWFVVNAFRVHVLWGLGVIFVPFVSLVFVVMHWAQAKTPFLLSVTATALLVAALVNQPGFMDAYRKAYARSYAATQARMGLPLPQPPVPEAASNPAGANVPPVALSEAQQAAMLGIRYNQHVAELQKQCVELKAERKTVHMGTAQESMYNVHLLNYNREIVEAQEEKRQLDRLNQSITKAAHHAEKVAVSAAQ